jgi:hypothetical protein
VRHQWLDHTELEDRRERRVAQPIEALRELGKYLLGIVFHRFVAPPCEMCGEETHLVDELLVSQWGASGLVEQVYLCSSCNHATRRSVVYGAWDEGIAA